MSDNNLSYYQRVVCIGLRKATKDSAVIRSGFLYWNHELANTEFDVSHVVDQLVNYLGLNGSEKKSLMIIMLAACNKLHEELPAVPQVLLEMVKQPSHFSEEQPISTDSNDDVLAAQSPEWQIMSHFLNYVAIYLRKQGQESFSEFSEDLKDNGVEGVSESLSDIVRAWANSGFDPTSLHRANIEGEGAALAHAIYLLIIDIIGPVDSDIIIHKVIDECLTQPAASRFDPRGLL